MIFVFSNWSTVGVYYYFNSQILQRIINEHTNPFYPKSSMIFNNIDKHLEVNLKSWLQNKSVKLYGNTKFPHLNKKDEDETVQ